MDKEELIILLKEYKENRAKLNMKLKKLKSARIGLKSCDDAETSVTANYGINQDIHSKNQISNKVLRKVEENETRREEFETTIKDLEKEVKNLREKVEPVEDRLECLKYKEKKMLEAYYIEGRSYEEIGNQLYFQLFCQTRNWETIKKIVEKAFNKMLNL